MVPMAGETGIFSFGKVGLGTTPIYAIRQVACSGIG